MPNVNTVSFMGPNADMAQKQQELLRRQKMVEMLQQQSMAPIANHAVADGAGRPLEVPISGFQSLAKMLQSGIGAYAQNKLSSDQDEFGRASASRYSDALKSMAPPGVFDTPGQQPPAQPPPVPAAPIQPPATMNEGSLPMENPTAEPPQSPVQSPMQNQPPLQPPGGAVSPAKKAAWASALRAMQVNPDLGNKLMENLLTQTTEQKNWDAQGLDPSAVGSADMAKKQADALVNVAPGNTVFNPASNKPVFAGPDFKTGLTTGFGPDGQPQISPMQGSQAIPQMAGDVKRAESAASAGYSMVTVNTPNGPVMMTQEQAAQMAGGGRPAGPQPVNYTASNGVKLDFAQQSPQQIFQAAQASGDPQVMQAFNEWSQSAAPHGGPGNGGVGIPLQSDAQREAQVGTVKTAQEVEKDRLLRAQSPEQLQKANDAATTGDLLAQAKTLIPLATGSGVGNLRDKAGALVGKSTDASQAAAKMKVLGAQLMLKQPRMEGPQSDADSLLYREMAGRLGDSTVPVGDKLAAHGVMEYLAAKYQSDNQNSVPTQVMKKNKGTPGAAPALTPAEDAELKALRARLGR